MKIITPCVALLLLGVVACGEDVAAPPRTTPRPPTIEVAEARAIAQAAQLRAADLPGYRAATDGDQIPDDPLAASGGTCVKQVGPEALADANADFAHGAVQISSRTSVYGTAEQVLDGIAYAKTDEFLPCLERAFTYLLATERLTVTDFTSRRVAVTLPAAATTYGVSMRMTLRYEALRLRMHLLVLVAAVGHAEVGVSGIAVGKGSATAPSVGRLTPLLAKCVRRARAAEA